MGPAALTNKLAKNRTLPETRTPGLNSAADAEEALPDSDSDPGPDSEPETEPEKSRIKIQVQTVKYKQKWKRISEAEKRLRDALKNIFKNICKTF